MRILVVGAGGVGSAVPAIAQRRAFFEHMTVADIALARAEAAVTRLREPDRFAAAQVDASDEAALVALIRELRADAVLNACDPRFNEPIFAACHAARVTYLDMAMTLSRRHPTDPYRQPGVLLGEL